MAVLALNLMHDIPSGRRFWRAAAASSMAVALSRDHFRSAMIAARLSDTDVLGHGLPSPRSFTAHRDAAGRT
jgi:hypothetical protein